MEIVSVIFVIVIISAMGFLLYKLLNEKPNIDGYIVITEDEDGKKKFSLELDKDPDEIAAMDFITFKVTDEATEEDE